MEKSYLNCVLMALNKGIIEVSVVIPTLNEEQNIKKTIDGVSLQLCKVSHEIIVVDGYSNDRTVAIARENGAIVLFDDIGKGSALIKGFMNARGAIIISMDADLSNRSIELRSLIASIRSGYDIAMGSRFIKGGRSDDISVIRRAGNKFFVFLVNAIFGSEYTDLCYGYRGFRKDILKDLDLKEMGFGIETEISIKARKKQLKTIEIPSYEKKRAAGTPKLRTVHDGLRILKTIIKNILV